MEGVYDGFACPLLLGIAPDKGDVEPHQALHQQLAR